MTLNLGTAQIIQGNALNLPLPDSSVDLICTSPPYFGLRSYQDAGVHYDGQIGSEATPAEFLEALLAATREMVRVLKPSGSIFVNLGDKYNSVGSSDRSYYDKDTIAEKWRTSKAQQRSKPRPGIPPKSLMGIPWRYALQCIDELGLILRAEIIWAKPNGLPESVTDRVRRSHEQWFHLTRSPRYFSAVDEIREPQDTLGKGRPWSTEIDSKWAVSRMGEEKGSQGLRNGGRRADQMSALNPLGKLPGSVWTIPTQPLTVPPELGVDHFAAYPMEWPRRIIQGWTPNGICTACGEGRRPISEVQPQAGLTGELVETRRREPSEEQQQQIAAFVRQHREAKGMSRRDVDDACGTNTACHWWEGRTNGIQLPGPVMWRRLQGVLELPPTWDHIMLDTYMRPSGTMTTGPALLSGRHQTTGHVRLTSSTAITGYKCGCMTPPRDIPPTRPAVVLDPFGGTGTTALVAKALGRTGISIDLSNDYCRLAEWRCNDPRELAAALQVEKPEPVHPDQLDLFSGIE